MQKVIKIFLNYCFEIFSLAKLKCMLKKIPTKYIPKAVRKNAKANLNMIITAKGLFFGMTKYNIRNIADTINIGNLINHLLIEDLLNSFIYSIL